MSTPLDDLLIIVEWLSASKTPPPNVASAFERIRSQLLLDRVKPSMSMKLHRDPPITKPVSLHVPLPDPLEPLLHGPSDDTA